MEKQFIRQNADVLGDVSVVEQHHLDHYNRLVEEEIERAGLTERYQVVTTFNGRDVLPSDPELHQAIQLACQRLFEDYL
jgi:hypothetical protein